MEIKPPYGYGEIVPLTKAHRVAIPAGREVPAAFRRLNAVPLSLAEFAPACRDYPLAFVAGDGGAYLAMAVLGLEAGQNLFAKPDGTWEDGVYVPAYVRRYPFCMTRVSVDGREQPERIACVEKQALDSEGASLHDADGNALPLWDERKALLFEYEGDLARTAELCRKLEALAVLEPFTVQARPASGPSMTVSGMSRVSEQKLHGLSGEQLKELAQSGLLAGIYAHLVSLANFARLLERRSVSPAAVARTA